MENLMDILRQADIAIDRLYGRASADKAPAGYVAIGTDSVRQIMKADTLSGFIRSLRQPIAENKLTSAILQEALTIAKLDGRRLIKSHNAKTRDYTQKIWEDANEDILITWYRQFERALS